MNAKTHLEKADFPGCFKEERDNFQDILNDGFIDVSTEDILIDVSNQFNMARVR